MSSSLEYKNESAWKLYNNSMRLFTDRYVDFLSTCKTEREVIQYVEKRLTAAGYSNDPSAKLFVCPFREKALFAAKRGSEPLSKGISLIAAHADSPRLDLKQHPILEQADLVQGQTHYYGGIKKYQWLSRPLALHGVIVKEDGEKVRLVIGEDASDPVFCIADLLPHLGHQELTKTLEHAFDGEKMKIVIGHKWQEDAEEKKEDKKEAACEEAEAKDHLKKSLLQLLFNKYGIREEDFITAEVEVVPAGRARYVGFDESVVGAYGQDDRICVFTALEALLASNDLGRTKAVMFWDKEEIGSQGSTGASAKFFQYCIEDLARLAGLPAGHVLLATEAISADVTAAIDPDYQDLHEKENSARFGFGPCFCKFTGSKGKFGASEADAEYFAQIRKAFNSQNVPWQAAELGKVDVGGGGTVALFMAAWGMKVIDLGPALLAMHSPFELSSCADIYGTWKAYTAFLDR